MFQEPGKVTNWMANGKSQLLPTYSVTNANSTLLTCLTCNVFSRWVGDLLVVLVVQDDVVRIDDDVGHNREGRESSRLAGFYLGASQLPKIGLISTSVTISCLSTTSRHSAAKS